jgi:hypothetical protein
MAAKKVFLRIVAASMTAVLTGTAAAEFREDGRDVNWPAQSQPKVGVQEDGRVVYLGAQSPPAVAGQNQPGVVVLDFDDLAAVSSYGRLPSAYHGLEWDSYYDNDSVWWDWKSFSADPTYAQPHSGDNYLINSWGSKYVGFSLPHSGDTLLGAWFGSTTVPTPLAVRFNGYDSSHQLVQQSAWLTLSSTPLYLDAHFSPVARIEVEQSSTGAAWYAMDDLTYAVPEPSTLVLLYMSIAGLAACAWRRRESS